MTRRIAVLVISVMAATGLAACSNGDDSPTAVDGTTTTAGDTTTTAPPDGDDAAAVRVYFVAGEMVATAGRAVVPPAVGREAIEALLDGPSDGETGIGMSSAIPDGTELLDVTIADGVAIVDLSGDFASGGGSLSVQLRVAQVVFTLTQFDTVDAVTIWLDGGEATEGIGGEGVAATEVDRADMENVVPLVLVESPVPFEEVSSPLTVTGWSNTFEATVQVNVTDPEGRIVAEAFTTATAGSGVWGTFTVDVSYELDPSLAGRLGAVIGFEDSAQDGSQINVYEVPVRMVP